jgi:opacity protein-like surface antigen
MYPGKEVWSQGIVDRATYTCRILMDDDGFFVTFNINLKGRKMKFQTKKFSTIIILSLLAFVMTSAVCSAQGGSRSGKTEIYGILETLGGYSESTSFFGTTIEAGFDDAFVYGAGLGYNITDNWNLNTDFVFGSQDAYVETGTSKATESANVFLWNVNVDYNILAEPLTPLVSGGLGYAIYSGEGDATCFTFNIGAGGRWDISDNIFIKALYRMTWFETDDQNGIYFGVGYMF